MQKETGYCTVAVGSPFDGMSLYGTFEDPDDAVDWAVKHCHSDTWWVMSILVPETEAHPVPNTVQIKPTGIEFKHGLRGEDIGDVPY